MSAWNRKAMICTAKSKTTQVQCKQPAAKGKDKCRFHGGATPIKHGLHSKYAQGTLRGRIEAAQKDPELLNLERVIAVGQGLMDHALEQTNDAPAVDAERVDALRKLCETVGKLIVSRRKNVEAAENMVPLEVVGLIIDKFVDAVNRFVSDDEAKRGILTVLSQVEHLPGPRAVN